MSKKTLDDVLYLYQNGYVTQVQYEAYRAARAAFTNAEGSFGNWEPVDQETYDFTQLIMANVNGYS